MIRVVVLCALATAAGAEQRRSGFDDMSAEIRAMQEDDFANPGMFWVAEGEELWAEPAGTAALACAECHDPGDMAGVAARYPAWDEGLDRPVDLEARINLCRVRHQDAPPLERESRALLALTAFVANHSRGMPIDPPEDARLASARGRGAQIFSAEMGQLDLSCADCHEANAGRHLAAALIPEAHPTGYPIYRLEWQELGSLDRRLGNCTTGVRAEPLVPGSADAVALKLYLMSRAAGMEVETPAVRP